MTLPRQQCLTVAPLLLSFAAMLALALSGCASRKAELPPLPGDSYRRAPVAAVAAPAPAPVIITNRVTLAWDLTAYADRTGLDASNDMQTWTTIADYPVTINGVVRQHYTNTVTFTNNVQSWRAWTR